MNPLDDHELLLWATRAGLTRDEVRQAGRKGLDAGHIPRQGAEETDAQHINLDMKARPVVYGVGVEPLELLERPTALVEGFQACDVVVGQQNLPVEVGGASYPVWSVCPQVEVAWLRPAEVVG